ncbi:hypothetical protein M5689_010444 [Euphorbia peplus]|nr:hypothetical protein M5689_010444 [Euphorbia peplus]
MKYNVVLSVVVLVVALLITSGEAIGNCDEVMHGGGCEVAECHAGCQAKYGTTAHGFCYTLDHPPAPENACICRFPCSSF